MQKPEHLASGSEKVLAGSFRVEGFFQGGDAPQDGKIRIDALVVAGGGILGDTAGKGDDGLAVFFRQLGNADGGFAHHRLGIQPAFAGDHQISGADRIFDTQLAQNQINAAVRLAAEEREKGEADAAGGTCAILVTIGANGILTKKQLWVAGAIGAVAHSIGQMAMAIAITATPSLAVYLPVMILCSVITGLFTGLCAQLMLNRGTDIWKTFLK